MTSEPPLLLGLDLAGTFAFALNGALTAVRHAKLDIVGVVSLGMVTALGGGIIRDIMIGAIPPAAFRGWHYLVVAAAGGFVAFLLSRRLDRLAGLITVLDAAGLSLFAVTGAAKALDYGLSPFPAVIIGAVTGVGGGVLRDVLARRVPIVLHSELYAIPALAGAALVAATRVTGAYGVPAAIAAAVVCFAIRMLGVRLGLNAPVPPGRGGGDSPRGT